MGVREMVDGAWDTVLRSAVCPEQRWGQDRGLLGWLEGWVRGRGRGNGQGQVREIRI